MSQVCEICGKGPGVGKNISHSHRRTNRRFLPNLAVKKVTDPKTGYVKRTKICTNCIKTISKAYIQSKLPLEKKA
jgi:large subunit ribosomal protein L28